MQVQTVAKFFILLLLCGCAGEMGKPKRIAAPANAQEVRVAEAPDGSSYEVSFTVASDKEGYTVVNFVEGELQRSGYTRCAQGGGQWEILRRNVDGQIRPETRLLRNYRTSNPNQLAVVVAVQDCADSQSCVQRFVVRQIDVSDVKDGDVYARKVCR